MLYDARLQRARGAASRAGFAPLGVWVANTGSVTAHDTRAVITIAKAEGLRIIERRNVEPTSRFNPLHLRLAGDFLLALVPDCWELKLDVGKVQPKSQDFVPSVFYVDVDHAVETQVSVSVFADNLPEPIAFTTVLRVTLEELDLTVEEFEEALKRSEG